MDGSTTSDCTVRRIAPGIHAKRAVRSVAHHRKPSIKFASSVWPFRWFVPGVFGSAVDASGWIGAPQHNARLCPALVYPAPAVSAREPYARECCVRPFRSRERRRLFATHFRTKAPSSFVDYLRATASPRVQLRLAEKPCKPPSTSHSSRSTEVCKTAALCTNSLHPMLEGHPMLDAAEEEGCPGEPFHLICHWMLHDHRLSAILQPHANQFVFVDSASSPSTRIV